jgi:hypothetical protein
MPADAYDASVASDASSVIILAQYGPHSSINLNFLLLDSQSSVNLFSNPHHVNNVCPANYPINVHCNKGVMTTNTVANFGANKVYLEEDEVAKVLLLYLLVQKHHITYNSHDCHDCHDCDGVFKVHTSDGLLEFKPAPMDLHVLDLQDTLEASHLLFTSSQPSTNHLHVNTVRAIFKGFTKKQVKHAHQACCLMLITGVPTERAIPSLVSLNQLKDCPITHDDIKNAHAIFGPDLANIRGKTVLRNPDRVLCQNPFSPPFLP